MSNLELYIIILFGPTLFILSIMLIFYFIISLYKLIKDMS